MTNLQNTSSTITNRIAQILSIRMSLMFAIILLTLLMIDGYVLQEKSERQGEHVHTWHTIVSLNGSWYGNLHVMTENEKGVYFVDGTEKHAVIQNPFTVTESSPMDYGLVINEEDDFNMLYSLTLNQQVIPDPSQSNSRICVYLIAARRAADPQIIPISFNGNTTCLWQTVQGRGENFWVL